MARTYSSSYPKFFWRKQSGSSRLFQSFSCYVVDWFYDAPLGDSFCKGIIKLVLFVLIVLLGVYLVMQNQEILNSFK